MWPLPFRRYMGTAGGSILSFIWNIPKRAVGVLDFNSLGLVSRSQCPVLPALGSGYLLPLRLHDACIPGCSVRHIRQRWQKNHFSITQSSPKRCRTGFQTLSWFLPAWVSVVIILRSEVTQPCCHLEDRVDLPGKVLFPPSAGRAGIPQARLLTPVRGWLLKSSIRSRPRSLFFCPAPLLKTAVGPVREFTGMWACSRSHLPDPTLCMRGKMCMPIKKIPTHFQKRAKRKWIICLKANQSEWELKCTARGGQNLLQSFPLSLFTDLILFYAFWLIFSPVPTLRELEDPAVAVKEKATKWTKLVLCDHTGDRRVWRKGTIDIFTSRRKESSDEAKCVREVGNEFLLRKHISLHDGLLAPTHHILRSLSPLLYISLPLGRSFEI